MKAVQYIMGHKDICTTLKYYAEPTDEGIRNSMCSLERQGWEADKNVSFQSDR